MTRRIPQDPNYHTSCPAAIKAKITALENAAITLGLEGARSTEYVRADLADARLRELVATRFEPLAGEDPPFAWADQRGNWFVISLLAMLWAAMIGWIAWRMWG